MRRNKLGVMAWLVLLWLAAPAAWSAETTWMADGNLGIFTGSDPEKSARETNSSGPLASWYVSPVVFWKDARLRFTPSWDFNYSGVNTVLKIDDNNFLFAQQATDTFNLGGSWDPGDNSRLKLKAFYTGFNGKQTKDEDWGRGLYDYGDLGAWGSWTLVMGDIWKAEAGYRYTRRGYPNYFNLSSTDLREKDCGINKVSLDLSTLWSQSATSTLSYALQVLDYPQGYVADATGTTNAGTLRHDTINTFSITVPVTMEPWEWSLGYNLERRLSNFAFVDPQEVSVYESYNSYAEHTFNASLSRGFDDWGFLASPRLAFNGSASTRMYDTRPAKTADGNYSGQKQHDEIYLATLELTNKFSDHWGGYASVNWSAYRSNTANETSSLYNYNFVSLSLGTQFSY